MQRLLLALSLLFVVHAASAGEADNISACVNKAKVFSGVTLDAFDAKYDGKVLSYSLVKWPNAFCEVKLGEVQTLQVNGKDYVYKGFAGKESYDLNTTLQSKTDEAIRQMKSRIALLEQRASQVSVSLRKPNPDHKYLTQYIEDGVQKSLGNSAQSVSASESRQSTEIAPIPAQPVAKQETTAKQTPPAARQQETMIPRSMPDKGKYYLLEAKQEDGVIKALHKRVGADATGYTRTEINCRDMQYREMGYSETSPAAIRERAGNWTGLIDGSSKSDLVQFVCAQ